MEQVVWPADRPSFVQRSGEPPVAPAPPPADVVRLVLAGLPDVAHVYDAEWRWLYLNPAAEAWVRSLGVDPAAVLGRRVWDVFPAAVGGLAHEAALRAAAERREVVLRAPIAGDGRHFETRIFPVGAMIVSLSRDVTSEHEARAEAERERAEAERAARSALLARLTRVTGALAAATTTDDVARAMLDPGLAAMGATAGVVCRLTPDAAEIDRAWTLGYPEDQLEDFRRVALTLPLPPRDVVRTRAAVYVESPEAWLARYLPPGPGMDVAPAAAGLPLLVGDRLVGVMVLRFPAPRGFDAEDRALLASVASQCAQALERARLFEAERAARAAAEEANRAKMHFLTTMSHELRTPLNAIAGYAELLALGVRGPVTEAQRQDLERIRDSQRHLLGLINDVLNFARLDAGRVDYAIADVSLHAATAAVEALVTPQLAAKGIRFVHDGCDAGVVARADAEKVRQILLNLLSNAVKYTPDGGAVRVSCGRDGPGEGRAVVRVADSGVGIEPAKLEHVFEPFVQLGRTLTSRSEGTGLGLAISRELARAMGGDLTAESEPGAGSTFTLTLPLA